MKKILIPAYLSTVLAPLHAEEAKVDEILVTAFSRTPQPLSTVGASLSVLTADDLKAGQQGFVADALEQVPGVAITRTGAYGTATIAIRGATTDQTVTLIDGVEVNDVSTPGGGFNFAYLDSFDIDRVEVLKGPQSLMYGSKAIGGVVSVITAAPKPGLQLAGSLEAGSFDTVRAGGRIAGGSEAVRARLSVFGERSDGISSAEAVSGNAERDGFRNLALKGGIFVDPTENWELRLDVRHARGRADYDGYTPDFSAPADAIFHEKNRETAVSAASALTWADGRGHWDLAVDYAHVKRDSFSDFPYAAEGSRRSVHTLARVDVTDMISFSAGGEASRQKAETVAPDAIDLSGLFGEVALKLVEGLTLTGGVRHDHNSRFGNATTARATANYRIDATGTRLHASYGEGFKAPTIFQLIYICDFCGLTEPNGNLRPERAKGYEAGIEQTAGDFRIGATAFRRTTRDQIDFDYLAGYANIASALSKGVELEASFRAAGWLEVAGNYAYVKATDRTTGDRLARIPRHQADLRVTVTPSRGFDVTASIHHNGLEVDAFSPGTAAWTRLDLKAQYAVTDKVQLYGRIENATDKAYQHVYGYGTPGASAYAGVRVNY